MLNRIGLYLFKNIVIIIAVVILIAECSAGSKYSGEGASDEGGGYYADEAPMDDYYYEEDIVAEEYEEMAASSSKAAPDSYSRPAPPSRSQISSNTRNESTNLDGSVNDPLDRGNQGNNSIVDNSNSEVNTQPQDTASKRLIIYSADLRIEVHSPYEVIAKAEKLAIKYGGYIARSSENQIIIKVKAPYFNEALEEAVEYGRLLDKNVSAQDVTEAFLDLKTRLENARRVKAQLEQLIARTTKIEDLIRLEKQLFQISQEITQMEEQLRSLKHLIAFSTITINMVKIQEVEIPNISNPYFGFIRGLGIGKM
jgi:hypothetical protein